LGICVVRLTINFKIKYDTSLAYNIYTVLCTVKLRDVKILYDLKCRIPSITFCYKNKAVTIRYWGKLKFDKVVLYGA